MCVHAFPHSPATVDNSTPSHQTSRFPTLKWPLCPRAAKVFQWWIIPSWLAWLPRALKSAFPSSPPFPSSQALSSCHAKLLNTQGRLTEARAPYSKGSALPPRGRERKWLPALGTRSSLLCIITPPPSTPFLPPMLCSHCSPHTFLRWRRGTPWHRLPCQDASSFAASRSTAKVKATDVVLFAPLLLRFFSLGGLRWYNLICSEERSSKTVGAY